MSKMVKTIILIILACVLIFGGMLVGINWEKWFGDKPPDTSGEPASTGGRLNVDPNAGDYVPQETQKTEPGTGVAIPGWGYITIPAGEKNVTVDFPNPEANAGKYYLTFELRLKNTGEVLYTSGLVPPGKHIQQITLSHALTEGTYKAVIHVQPYKMDEAQTPTNNADMETDLVVYK